MLGVRVQNGKLAYHHAVSPPAGVSAVSPMLLLHPLQLHPRHLHHHQHLLKLPVGDEHDCREGRKLHAMEVAWLVVAWKLVAFPLEALSAVVRTIHLSLLLAPSVCA